MSNDPASGSAASKKGRAAHGGPKIKKIKSAVPLGEKQKAGKSLDLSLKRTTEPLEALPADFKDGSAAEELRRLDLSGQARIFHAAGLSQLRFAGGTLTWLNLSGVDCSTLPSTSQARPGSGWAFLRMMETLFVLTLSNCNLESLPKELEYVPSLKALVASHNQLTSPSLEHLHTLENLNSLILSDNKLTEFPASTLHRLKSLKKLSLANNAITANGLPTFAPLSGVLEELRLNGNSAIQSAPSIRESTSDSASLSLIELSHTGVSTITQLESLKGLSTLVNLGLRNTPIAEQANYREEITQILPNLRILDNVRFDPLYLARKAKGKEPEAPSVSKKESSSKVRRPADSGWQQRTDTGADSRRKRKPASENVETDGGGASKSNLITRTGQRSQDAERTGVSAEPEERPKKKRAHNRTEKRVAVQAQAEPAKPRAKDPKSVGGSMSQPKGTDMEPSAAGSASLGEVDLKRLAQSKSAVAGIVEIVAPSKRTKERPNQRGRMDKNGGLVQADPAESAGKQADVLAALEHERAKAAFQSCWD